MTMTNERAHSCERPPRASRYTPSPHLPEERRPTYEAMLDVLVGTTSVSEAARVLAMPRNHFQSCLHRVQGAMIAALPTGHRTGRPEKPAALRVAEATIRAQARTIETMTSEVTQLRAQLEATSSLLKERTRLPATTRTISTKRSRRSRGSRESTTTSSSSEGG